MQHCDTFIFIYHPCMNTSDELIEALDLLYAKAQEPDESLDDDRSEDDAVQSNGPATS